MEDDKKGLAANVLIVILGGRKLTGLILTLAALIYGPKEAYATIAMVFGMFVGGNGIEHWTNGKDEPTESIEVVPLPESEA